jgi:hypothetical protein
MKKNNSIHAAVLALGVVLAACSAGVAQASSPGERIVCTTLPGQAWLGEEKIRAIFGASDYLRADFKVSKTRCYEFYAIKKNGDIVEAYYHPVTGELVKRNVLFHAAGVAAAAAPASAAASSAGAANSAPAGR